MAAIFLNEKLPILIQILPLQSLFLGIKLTIDYLWFR